MGVAPPKAAVYLLELTVHTSVTGQKLVASHLEAADNHSNLLNNFILVRSDSGQIFAL
jgi:hypothetical protein